MDVADSRALISSSGDTTRAAERPLIQGMMIFTFVAGAGGFLFGYDTGVISGALPFIRDHLPQVGASTSLQSLVVSGAVLGAVFGAASAGLLSDAYGRRSCLVVADLLFTLGAAVMALAPNATVLILGRLVVGFGVGMASMVVPVYIAEASRAENRARLVSVNTVLITLGQFMSFVVNSALRYQPHQWRWMLGVCAVPAVLQLIGLQMLPESPRWLVKQGRLSEARLALKKLRMGQMPIDFENEMNELQNMKNKNAMGMDWSRLKETYVQAQLKIGVGLQVLQQLCGINTIMYFTPVIIEFAGFDKHSAVLLSTLPAFVNMLGSLVGVYCIDRTGRRRLLLGSLAGVSLSLLLLGHTFKLAQSKDLYVTLEDTTPNGEVCDERETLGNSRSIGCKACAAVGCGVCTATMDVDAMTHWKNIFYGQDHHMAEHILAMCLTNTSASTCEGTLVERGVSKTLQWHDNGCPNVYGQVSIFALVLYLATFSPGLSPVPWAVNAEIYHQDVRGLAAGMATTANWVTNFLVSHTFLHLTIAIGIGNTFWMFASIAALGMGVYYQILPETKGLTLEQIQGLFFEESLA